VCGAEYWGRFTRSWMRLGATLWQARLRGVKKTGNALGIAGFGSF